MLKSVLYRLKFHRMGRTISTSSPNLSKPKIRRQVNRLKIANRALKVKDFDTKCESILQNLTKINFEHAPPDFEESGISSSTDQRLRGYMQF